MNELTTNEINPGAIVKRNEEVCRIVGPIVRAKYTQVIQGRNYLTVQGAQAIASSLGYTSGTASLRHVEPTDTVAGYWEATCTVLLNGVIVGSGIGSVFDDERPWNTRPQFARQMMAQTRATGRALKGVMGWAFAALDYEGSIAEEMPEEATRMPQDASAPRKALAAPSKASKPAEGKPAPKVGQQIRGICSGVDPKTAKSGKQYWRVGLEANGVEWFTSFSAVDPDIIGKLVVLHLKPWQDGVIITDIQVVVEEEVPF
tara:strand:- start:1505 stop:2281 length:777 start_codon:yes stop_codon:yes gene_type:complete